MVYNSCTYKYKRLRYFYSNIFHKTLLSVRQSFNFDLTKRSIKQGRIQHRNLCIYITMKPGTLNRYNFVSNKVFTQILSLGLKTQAIIQQKSSSMLLLSDTCQIFWQNYKFGGCKAYSSVASDTSNHNWKRAHFHSYLWFSIFPGIWFSNSAAIARGICCSHSSGATKGILPKAREVRKISRAIIWTNITCLYLMDASPQQVSLLICL